MPLIQEEEQFFASVLENERNAFATRVSREESHAKAALQEAADRVAVAKATAKAHLEESRKNAAAQMALAEEHRGLQAGRFAQERQAAERRLEEARRSAAARVQASELIRDKAKAEIETRLQKARQTLEEARRKAEVMVQASLAEGAARETAYAQQEAEVRRRWAVQVEEFEAREAQRIVTAEKRAAFLEEAARQRMQVVEAAAASQIETYLAELRKNLLRVDEEWLATTQRVALEKRKSGRQVASTKASVEDATLESKRCQELAAETLARADVMADEVKEAHRQWRSEAVQRVVEEMEHLGGLQDLAEKLNSGALLGSHQRVFPGFGLPERP